MVRPQSENLNRSGNTPLDPDSIGGALDARDQPEADDRTGAPVPPENRPGHHPEVEQDQPDTDAFIARFGGAHDDTTPDPGSFVTRTTTLAVAVGASAWRVAQATVQAIRTEAATFRHEESSDA